MPDQCGSQLFGKGWRVTTSGQLARRLGLGDAVVIGLGSMIGAGVFAAFGPAAEAAGSGLLVGLLIAVVIAYCNATSSAQLAAVYPESGGTYVYGRERLGEWWGFAAGWMFVIGKTASCAAMAMTVAAYALPNGGRWQRLVAIAAVIALTALNSRGISKTALVTRVLVVISLTCLAAIVLGVVGFGTVDSNNAAGWFRVGEHGVYGVLQSAGLLFFAFAGYARIATLGEEVVAPERTIPRAIPMALFITAGVYLAVAVTALLAAGADRLAASDAPLVTVVEAAGVGGMAPLVRIGGLVAGTGALLGLIAGVGRTSLAMARRGDLPRTLGAVHPTYHVPHHAEIGLAVVVCVVLLFADLRGVIGFSSFGVLLYYAIANVAAFTQKDEHRRWPRWLQVLGVIGCLALVATLPVTSIVVGVLVALAGVIGRAVFRRS